MVGHRIAAPHHLILGGLLVIGCASGCGSVQGKADSGVDASADTAQDLSADKAQDAADAPADGIDAAGTTDARPDALDGSAPVDAADPCAQTLLANLGSTSTGPITAWELGQSDNLLLLNVDGSGLYTMSKNGGTPTQIAAMSDDRSYSVPVADASGVYWVDSEATVVVKRVGLTGGIVSTVVASDVGAGPLRQTASSLFFTNSTNTAVASTDKSGANRKTIVPSTMVATSIGDFAIDATNVYFIDGKVLKQAPQTGTATTATTLYTDATSAPALVTSDGSFVYFVSGSDQTIKRVPVGGGTVVSLYVDSAPSGFSPRNLVVDGTNLYFNFGYTGMGGCQGAVIRKMPKTGGAPTQMATGACLNGMIVDDKYIFWRAKDSNYPTDVYRICK